MLVRTVVTREVEWDDRQRDRMLALTYYERGVCACGFHTSIARDKSNFFAPETDKCPVCAGEAQYDRALRKQDEQWDKMHQSDPPMAARPTDGRRPHMRLLTPDEVEQEREKRGASPARFVSRSQRP